MTNAFRRYLLPGFVFQSIIIAGGYGTGRELVEFFLRFGPVGGLLGMLVPSMLLMSVVCAVAFELARRARTYDYRTFFERLIGPGWMLYELGYLITILLVLAVIGAAAGTFLEETLGAPYALGVVVLMMAIGVLVLAGSRVIENALALWSFVLYACYLVLFVWSYRRFGPSIAEAFATGEARDGWFLSGFRYASLQVALMPAMLFATRHIRRRREALIAGLLAGPITVVPGVLFLLAMTADYPAILERAVPANHLLELLGSRGFQLTFQLVLFGTLIETGTGLIHAFNERIAAVYRTRGHDLAPALRPLIAVGLLLAGALLTRFGLVALVARGYGAMTWVFMLIVVAPLLTLGVARVARPDPASTPAP